MKKFFSLVEVTLSIAVVGIGIAGVMSLFPVGVQASRDAIGDNYSADAVEQMLAYFASAAQSSWTTFISSDGDPATGTIKEFSDPAGTDIATEVTNPTSTAGWVQLQGNVFILGGTVSPYAPTYNDVFGIKQPATGNTDFTAHVKLWKAKITNMTISGAGGIELPYYHAGYNIGAARIYAEVSWPVEKPYAKRTKRVYALELFKQN